MRGFNADMGQKDFFEIGSSYSAKMCALWKHFISIEKLPGWPAK